MARLIKEWMKAKKGICSSDCECLTITGWRCYAEEHLCNCGDSSAPVPPTPTTYTYTLEKTSTRGGGTDTYTASKYVTGESNPVKSYSLEAKYSGSDEIYDAQIGDCTTECDWVSIRLGDDEAMAESYVNMTADALTAGTQEAFKSIFDAYEDYYSYDEDYVYTETHMGAGYGNYDIYLFSKEEKVEGGSLYTYALALEYDDITGEITSAEMDDAGGSFDFTPLPDLSAAAALKAEYNAIVANPSQAACKRGYDDAKTLYDSLQ